MYRSAYLALRMAQGRETATVVAAFVKPGDYLMAMIS
jgi:hypothetical protein